MKRNWEKNKIRVILQECDSNISFTYVSVIADICDERVRSVLFNLKQMYHTDKTIGLVEQRHGVNVQIDLL